MKSYKGGKLGNLYTEGVQQNIAEFQRNILPAYELHLTRPP